MALITFMSDFGDGDHYVAAVKAMILRMNPGLNIVDISHSIEVYDLAHASYVLGSVFREFPEGTVHLVAVDSVGDPGSGFIGAQLEGHYFICSDNGLISLISEKEPAMVAQLFDGENPGGSNFPARDILAKAAAKLAGGAALDDIGTFTSDYRRLIPRKYRATKKQISGHVVRVDHYGNLITNIDEEIFNLLRKGRNYTVVIGREKVTSVNHLSNEVDNGDCFVIFNSGGKLEIGLKRGHASDLLGLGYDSPIHIIFEEEEPDSGK